jgi:hypothetical protein
MKTIRAKNKVKSKTEIDFIKEYNELFLMMEALRHAEWSKQGDHIKKFSLYENTPTQFLQIIPIQQSLMPNWKEVLKK